jgi:hypothetical protein
MMSNADNNAFAHGLLEIRLPNRALKIRANIPFVACWRKHLETEFREANSLCISWHGAPTRIVHKIASRKRRLS